VSDTIGGVEIDHVLVAVDDLDAGAAVLRERFGLESVEGGRHPRWGTANRIVPVGDAYLELVTVADHDVARSSAFGRWVARARPGTIDLIGWAVGVDDIEPIVESRGIEAEAGSRLAADGCLLTWRLAGVEQAAADPALPFFVEWGADTPHPSGVTVTHPAGEVRIERIDVSGDAGQLAAWLGEHDLPVRVEAGPSAVTRLVLRAGDGRLIIGRNADA
jgi:hypothetical protein